MVKVVAFKALMLKTYILLLVRIIIDVSLRIGQANLPAILNNIVIQ